VRETRSIYKFAKTLKLPGSVHSSSPEASGHDLALRVVMATKGGTVGRAGILMALLAGSTAVAQEPAAGVVGTVSVAGADGQALVIPGVALSLRCANLDPKTEISNELGAFQFVQLSAGTCSIIADLQGFQSATETVVLRPGETTVVALRLALDTFREEVTVTARNDAVSVDPIKEVDHVTAQEIRTAPIARERLQDALPLIPGVVRGPDGLLNIDGNRSNQSALTLNSANGTDPVTGEDAIELPIDAVDSVEVRGAAYAPEFGLSAGAVTTVETQRAGEAWHVIVNDLAPRLRRRGGSFRGLESFTPRVTLGGPIVIGKLSVLQSMQYEYSQTRVFGLPAFESDTRLQSFASFSRADWIVNQTSRVTASAMVSPRKTTYAGLNTFNPQGVTANIRNHNLLGSASDQIVVSDHGVFETRVSVKEFDSTIGPATGRGPMVLAPDVNAGSYFNDQDRTSRRTEWLSTYSFTPLGPTHVIKVGAGVTHEAFDGFSTSRRVDIIREDGTLSQRITFAGAGRLERGRTPFLAYAQDSWTIKPRFTVQYGARYDHDSITGAANLAPRASFTAVPSGDGRSVVRGGFGVFYNPVPLNVASFEQMQTRIETRFARDGLTTTGPSVEVPNVVVSSLRTPRSINWNVEIDRELMKNFVVRVGYQERHNRFEPVVDSATQANGTRETALRTDGRSRYREGQVTARYEFHGQDQVVGSYTRSSAFGNLNDFNTFFGNIETPVIRPDERGPLPWDAPHRLLLWSSVTLPRGFAVFPVLDVRTGFPLSNVDGDRNFVGPRNAIGRYPRFVSLDAQVAKTFRVFNHTATIGVKVFNMTDHFNPRDYQSNLASVNFGDFNNSVGRTFRGKWIFEF